MFLKSRSRNLTAGKKSHGIWRRRSADGKRKDAGSTPGFGSALSSKIVIYGHLSRDFDMHDSRNIKMTHTAAHLNAEIMRGEGGDERQTERRKHAFERAPSFTSLVT